MAPTLSSDDQWITALADPRAILLDLYRTSVAAVEGRRCAGQALGGEQLDAAVLAIGKAADAMFAGATDAPGSRIDQALLVAGQGYADAPVERPGVVRLLGGHPLPDRSSLAAGAAVADFLAGLPRGRPLLVLLSGGASSMVELLPTGLGLDDLVTINRWLLASGLGIADMNAVRRHLSALKGGRMARLLDGRPTRLLIMSDVPGNALHDIASGPLSPVPASARSLPDGLPIWIEQLCSQAPPMPAEDDPLFAAVTARIIADNARGRAAAQRACEALGVPVRDRSEPLAGDAGEVGWRIADQLCRGPSGATLWGGETSVALPPEPGAGGRCQHLALAAALRLAGTDDCFLLAAGSDGHDGDGQAAGAMIDGRTIERGVAASLDPAECLARADSGRFLAASDDLMPAAATGTNVADFVFALKLAGGRGASATGHSSPTP